jgi:hypothetical protein
MANSPESDGFTTGCLPKLGLLYGMTVEEFKEKLATSPVDEITSEILLAGQAAHVSDAGRNYIAQRIAETFGFASSEVQVWIVGSAKLGFSITEKKRKDRPVLSRFRPYGGDSDIDVAVVSTPIFDAIWSDLSRHAFAVAKQLPWESGRLGSYLVHGWLRPDHFPRGARLRRCDEWWDLFHSLSREPRFERHAVRGGLFHSVDELFQYQTRAVRECRQSLELST